MTAMPDEIDVKLQPVAVVEEEATFSVSVDGHALGNVTFATYYEPLFEAFDRYVALWAGPTLCVVDRHAATLQCVDRRDETHRVHAFEQAWIVEGELRIELFEPATLQIVAIYEHDEVITDSWVDGELVCIRDFQDRTVRLKPSENLRSVASAG